MKGRMIVNKVLSAAQAANMIKDGDWVSTSGFQLAAYPEELAQAVEKRFLDEGHPQNLTLFSCTQGGNWAGLGNDHFAHEGLLAQVICGHYGSIPKISQLAIDNKIECYNLPQGTIAAMMRATITGMPGELTKVGLNTYIDPRLEGGRFNRCTTKDIVEVEHFRGDEWLFYPAPKLDIGLIRGTIADTNGNLCLKDEICPLDIALVARAVRACGGKVIAQVKYVVEAGTLPAAQVDVPGIFVDAVVVCQNPEENHKQTAATYYDETLTGRLSVPVASMERTPLNMKKVMARRAAMELKANSVINLGIGTPEMISPVVAEEGLLDKVTMTTENGGVGGIPLGGKDFGAARNMQAAVPTLDQFDFYTGGGLDVAFLGLAEADKEGNINVSKFGDGLTGCGGFINIITGTKKIIYMGTFTAGGLKCKAGNGKLEIIQEGKVKKFRQRVGQVSFSGKYATHTGQDVLYITERAVFKLIEGGLELIELAPGVDLQKDILDQMEFKPAVSPNLKAMEACIFNEANMVLENFWAD